MKRSRFAKTHVVPILEEADAGMKVKEVCRKHGINWLLCGGFRPAEDD